MRRRKRKGAEERLLSNSEFVINGMLDMEVCSDVEDGIGEEEKTYAYRIPVKNEKYSKIVDEYRGSWRKKFARPENPLHIEVGSGKCGFITKMAAKNRNINYIACDVKEEVLLSGVAKAKAMGLDNVIFLWGNVELFDTYFEDGELDRIYINFCDPWPKKRNAKRRLTHTLFLHLYRKKLDDDGEIHFKTDNRGLFEFSLNEFCQDDWILKNISLDLANSSFESNETTEYEEKFMKQGLPIYRLEAKDRIRK